MENEWHKIILFISIFLQKTPGSESRMTAEGMLLNNILDDYERFARPVSNISDIVVVNFGLRIAKVFELESDDEKEGLMKTFLWHTVAWQDSHLHWDPADYEHANGIHLPTNRIWKPDIYLYNGDGGGVFEGTTTDAVVTHIGNVTVVTTGSYTTNCKFSYTNFPFDEQECEIKYGSWTYNGFEVDLKLNGDAPEADFTTYVQNSEWELLSAPGRRNVLYYSCCPEPFVDLTFTLHFKRQGEPILTNAKSSNILICLTLVLSFVIPLSSGHKITFALLQLLNLWWTMWNFSIQYPNLVTNSTDRGGPLLEYFRTLHTVCEAGFVANVFTVWLYHKIPPGPSWVRKYILHVLARLCRIPRKEEAVTTPLLEEKGDKSTNNLSEGASDNLTLNDWQHLACIIDRCLFVIFSIITLVMCFEIFPSYKGSSV